MPHPLTFLAHARSALAIAVLGGLAGIAAAGADAPADDGAADRGARLWVDQCWRCHGAYEPGARSLQDWHAVILHMRVSAILSRDDQHDLLAYLRRKTAHPAPPAAPGRAGG